MLMILLLYAIADETCHDMSRADIMRHVADFRRQPMIIAMPMLLLRCCRHDTPLAAFSPIRAITPCLMIDGYYATPMLRLSLASMPLMRRLMLRRYAR